MAIEHAVEMAEETGAADIEVTSDFICPWCWIGHQHLKAALQQQAERRGQDGPAIRFLPYELNPDMPAEGMPRRQYRSAKFGSWARSQALDAEVAAAGLKAGLQFHYDRVAVTPNTRLAHRLMVYAQQQGDAAAAAQLCQAIFAAYFSEGRDIGRADVLAELAGAAGLDGAQAAAFLAGRGGQEEVSAAQQRAYASYVRSVPTVRIGAAWLTGAQPVSVFARALDEAMPAAA